MSPDFHSEVYMSCSLSDLSLCLLIVACSDEYTCYLSTLCRRGGVWARRNVGEPALHLSRLAIEMPQCDLGFHTRY